MIKCKYPNCGRTYEQMDSQIIAILQEQLRIEDVLIDTPRILALLDSMYDHLNLSHQPACPYGCVDCVNDPVYQRLYHPEEWEKAGMPITCSSFNAHNSSCQDYDNKDK